jgi:hypothetical protein
MVRQILDALQGRSWKWAALRRVMINAHPWCSACLTPKRLDVHHCVPFHVDKSLELESRNLIVLCRRCHFLFGHFYDWQSYNPSVRADADRWSERIAKSAKVRAR